MSPADQNPPTGGHGGNRLALAARAGLAPEAVLDFSANINPLGMPESARMALLEAVRQLSDYPDPHCSSLREAVASHLGVAPEQVLPGNGAEQLIWWLPRLLQAGRLVVTGPCYLDYRRSADVWGLAVAQVLLDSSTGFLLDFGRLEGAVRARDLVWIGQPNNPTGQLVDPDRLAALAAARPEVWWAVDEAFIDFAADVPSLGTLGLRNLIVVRSMTKFYALAGLRLGYAVLAPDLADAGRRLLPDWSVSTPAQRVGVAVLTDPDLAGFAARTRQLISTERAALAAGLRRLGAAVTDGAANYLLLRLPQHAPPGILVADRLLREAGIAARTCDDYIGLDAHYLRVAVRTPEENARLISALSTVLADARGAGARQR